MLIKAIHQDWASHVVPKNAPPIQRIEMERSFYSGFRAALEWQLHHLAKLPDKLAVGQLDAAHAECEQYFKTLVEASKQQGKP